MTRKTGGIAGRGTSMRTNRGTGGVEERRGWGGWVGVGKDAGLTMVEEEPEASLELTKGGYLYFVIQELNFKREYLLMLCVCNGNAGKLA